MSNDQDDGYNDSNRAFLQALIAKSVLTFKEAQYILAAILSVYNQDDTRPESITQQIFDDYVQVANDAIAPFDMEIRSTQHQITNERIYSIINTNSDPSTQLATNFTADEISYVKRVLDAMFETNNTLRHEVMAIQPIQATKLHKAPDRRETIDGETQGSSALSITMVQAEKVMSSLVEQGWFEKSRKNYYSLSPRALMELRGWLEETYNDGDDDEDSTGPKIKQCHQCRELTTYGQRCPKLECLCRFHDTCAEGFFRVQRSRTCPICKTQWTGEDFVGERADIGKKNSKKQKARQSDVSQAQADSTQNALQSQTRRQVRNEISDDDE